MITRIVLNTVATFNGPVVTLDDLKLINYFYGANGSGKTTLSRVIECVANHGGCSIAWKDNTSLPTFVYNRDFVSGSFDGDLRGVFTLGPENLKLKADIKAKKEEADKLTDDKQKLIRTLSGEDGITGKAGELISLNADFADQCWARKVNHEAKLKYAFKGFMDAKDRFRDKFLREVAENKSVFVDLAGLEDRAATVFGTDSAAETELSRVNGTVMAMYEANASLAKIVVGRADVDVAAMIQLLGSSDWVRDGQEHLARSKPKCPFCQQEVPGNLENKLNDYFDTSYTDAIRLVEKLTIDFEAEAQRIKGAVNALVTRPSRRIDLNLLRAHQQTLTQTINANTAKLHGKKREPSTVVTLDPIDLTLAKINGMVDGVNVQIKAHNGMVANLAKERVLLTDAVWRYLIDVDLKNDLAAFISKKEALQKAIDAIKKHVASKDTELKAAQAELAALERQTTSVIPTMNAINALLKSFAFTTFSLKEGATIGTYELVRANGASAKETLSDGERTFLTFIYFYHLVKGSHAATGTTTKRVIVIDDPVSSLDSDVLFVVGSLIKNLFAAARDSSDQISQVFVMTHNIYFHKEVTFDSKRKGDTPRTDESFWVVRRNGSESKVIRCATNPVKSSYELLWAEVRDANRSPLTICNTLRRILENYFKLLGSIDPHVMHEKFDGEEKTICRSLVSWINDGSHFAMEDLHLSQGAEVVPKYLDVFRKVFETHGHEGHYKMMMGNAFIERPVPLAVAAGAAAAGVSSPPAPSSPSAS